MSDIFQVTRPHEGTQVDWEAELTSFPCRQETKPYRCETRKEVQEQRGFDCIRYDQKHG